MTADARVHTTCPYCGVGCGVLVEPCGDGDFAVRGDPDHPANFGRLCSKGSALADALTLDERLLHPEVGGRRVTWETALDVVARGLADTIDAHGPEAVGFYVSGQLLTEDYYVANKLMKGFIGSANIDTNSRLCMASAVAAHRRAFGADAVPCTYEDLELADLVVLVGSNLAWCHPVLFQRLAAARAERGTRVVVVDPRRTATAADADLHLPIRPEADVALFAGLLRHLASSGAQDHQFVAGHTVGLDAALAAAPGDRAEVAAATGLDIGELGTFFDLFARTARVVTVFSQGTNQSTVGTDKVNAIINCHLLTGRIGKPGCGPFSVTGQPNAMGGREVGGLANQLAAHMAIDDAIARDRVARFWNSPNIPEREGLKAVDLFGAVADGRIKALWIMATNPVVSMPEANRVRAALAACPLVVVSDVIRTTDTARHAHVLLPAAAWGEKDGTVTNSERRISRQRAFRPPPGEARPDWRIICGVAERLGFGAAFAYGSTAEIFQEHARLTAFENDGTRDLDLSGLAALDGRSYAAMAPVQWPVRKGSKAGGRLFGDGHFYTPDGRARFVPTPVSLPSAGDMPSPLVLNTGRIRDQWHTMTNTGRSARLSAHKVEPFVEINPADAVPRAIAPGALVEVENQLGRFVGRAVLSADQLRGSVFAPMHWTDHYTSTGRIGALVPAATDPISGQPSLKSATAEVRPFAAAWHAFAVLTERPRTIPSDYWALARAPAGWRLEMAGATCPDDWMAWASRVIGDLPAAEILAYHDVGAKRHRFAGFRRDRLIGAIFVSPEPLDLGRDFVTARLPDRYRTGAARLGLLAGRPAADRPDPGATVCSCFSVGRNEIIAAIAAGGCTSVETVGAVLRAGTNCGSCRPEIRAIIESHAVREAV